jgi:Cdc6-like AAA superfamily ATPase
MDSYGREAINTFTLLMSEFAGRIAVIFAGYEDEMNEMLESINPGLRGRFAYKFKFEDYGEEDLWDIFEGRLDTAGLSLERGAEGIVRGEITRMLAHKDKRFSNARAVNNFFQSLVNIQETRLASRIYENDGMADEELALLSVGDCEKLARSNTRQYSSSGVRSIGFAR